MFRSEASFPNYFAHLFAHKIFAQPLLHPVPLTFFEKNMVCCETLRIVMQIVLTVSRKNLTLWMPKTVVVLQKEKGKFPDRSVGSVTSNQPF